MYPFRAVIVGGSEAERTTIRREVTNLSMAVEYEFDDIDKAISQRPVLADTKCCFLVKVNSTANMDQLARLNQFFMGKPIVALLNEDSDLYESGLDSMAIMQFLILVEEEYGVALPESELTRQNFSTVRSIAGLIRARTAPSA